MVSFAVARLLLAVWLAAFAVQTTDLVALVAPDECTEKVEGTATDPCADGACTRCVCCARVPAFVPQGLLGPVVQRITRVSQLPPLEPFTAASPQGIFHVPKNS